MNFLKKLKLEKKIGFILLISLFSYFFIIARNKYETVAQISIKTSGDNRELSFQSFLNGVSGSSSKEDSRFLKVYLNSLDSMLDYKDLKADHRVKGIDIFSGLRSTKIEDKLKYFRSLINIKLEEDSNILTIKTLGFSPESSAKLNNYLLKKAESFVNNINQEINKKQLEFASKEGKIAKQRVTEASKTLQDFQDKNKLIDVNSEINTSNQIISKFESELAEKKVLLAINKKRFVNQKEPEILQLKNEINELERSILIERENSVSSEGKELNKKLLFFTKLKNDLDFSNDLYQTTLTSIENLRVSSIKQQRFIVFLSKPYLPEKQYLLWRFKNYFSFVFIILVISLLQGFFKKLIESMEI